MTDEELDWEEILFQRAIRFSEFVRLKAPHVIMATEMLLVMEAVIKVVGEEVFRDVKSDHEWFSKLINAPIPEGDSVKGEG